MPFETWHNYGYGICTDEIDGNTTVERVENLLACAPIFRNKLHSYFENEGSVLETVEDYTEYGAYGLAYILQEVIEEAEGIHFASCDNYDAECYLIYAPRYPWQITEKDASLTKEKIREILNKYVSILTDTEISVDYQVIENGT